VAEIVARYKSEGVYGFHHLRTRRSGSQTFSTCIWKLIVRSDFEDAHDITVKILRAIESEIPRSNVHIHTCPTG
jgi:ferrous-iron efflux pump FieF